MKIKERKVFSIDKFRGLDTENKPSKVASYRASSGENFMLDSDTLKIRPSFKYYTKPFLDDTIKIIDFYFFDGIVLYITNKGFKVKRDGVILGGIKIDYNGLENIQFNNLDENKPIFREEKDVLFIFGLGGGIYVFANIYEDNVFIKSVIYELNNKPKNTEYKDFPEPFIPTLFIGNDRLYDVNLLSNKQRYEIFAKADENYYYLPTNYNKEKNEDFSFELDVFDNDYNNTVLPFYLGKKDEDFFNDIDDTLLKNADNFYRVENTYTPLQDFEYREVDGIITPIKEILGLDKSKFFGLKIEDENITVYEKLLMYIKENINDILDNYILGFKVPYTATCKYVDGNDKLIRIIKEAKEEDIYVRINKKVGTGSIEIVDGYNEVLSNPKNTLLNGAKLVPSYPQVPADINKEVDLGVEEKAVLEVGESLDIYLEKQKSIFRTDILNRTDGKNTYEPYNVAIKKTIKKPEQIIFDDFNIALDTNNGDFISNEKLIKDDITDKSKYPLINSEFQNGYDLDVLAVNEANEYVKVENASTQFGILKEEGNYNKVFPNVNLSGKTVIERPDIEVSNYDITENEMKNILSSDLLNYVSQNKHLHIGEQCAVKGTIFTKKPNDFELYNDIFSEYDGTYIGGEYGYNHIVIDDPAFDHFPEVEGFAGYTNFFNIGEHYKQKYAPSGLFDDTFWNDIEPYLDEWLKVPANIEAVKNKIGNGGRLYFQIRISYRTINEQGEPYIDNWTIYNRIEIGIYPTYKHISAIRVFDVNTNTHAISNSDKIVIKNKILLHINQNINNLRNTIIQNANLVDGKFSYNLKFKGNLGIEYKKTNNVAFNTGITFGGYVNIKFIKQVEYQCFVGLYTIKLGEIADYTFDDLYSLDFNEDRGAFVLKLPHIYNYHHSPVIKLKLTFKENPDYSIIANSKIGINFGSENRLFLAGNKDYPNIDRFNASNDLLGDNVKSQSYELTYFPSKNYRILGSKGAINGYVLASDNQMYITKKEYPNDSKFFVRVRTMDDNGIVGYNEHKTNIDLTPINENSIVRFNNDIVVLDENGLYGVSVARNVLTNERHKQNRSSFVNSELVKQINKGKDVFVFEDNFYMFIYANGIFYVADSRYLAENPYGEIDNFAYELVKWTTPIEFSKIKKIDRDYYLLDNARQHIYKLDFESGIDILGKVYTNVFGIVSYNNFSKFTYPVNTYIDYKNSYFLIDNLYHLLGTRYIDYSYDGVRTITVINEDKFNTMEDVFKFYAFSREDVLEEYIATFNDDRTKITIDKALYSSLMYIDVSNTKLYVDYYCIKDDEEYFTFSRFKPDKVKIISQDTDANTSDLYITSNDLPITNVEKITEKPIELEWLSGVLDLGSDLQEKTMFRTYLYASKQDESNQIYLGYRTMRRYDSMNVLKGVDIANVGETNLDNLTFSLFSINTFAETGSSFPMKENNFLYIQFVIKGIGKIQLNGIKVIYKLNRLLKSIG